MRSLAAALFALGLTLYAVPQATAKATVANTTVAVIESQMVMPRGAQALAFYDRYYAPRQVSGRDVIVGVFVLRSSINSRTSSTQDATPVSGIAHAFTTVFSQLPVVSDGGCAVVTVFFDVATQRLARIRLEGVDAEPELGACNGRA